MKQEYARMLEQKAMYKIARKSEPFPRAMRAGWTLVGVVLVVAAYILITH